MDISTATECDCGSWPGEAARPQLPWHAAAPMIGIAAALLWTALGLLARQFFI
jgi:hypothetical protein